ncbi:hypothetical protein VNI00_006283 [Paramarasmius palmivorus]|uniref:Uncharacterized protein n=1 Tax=Paramarasmius palmivorus TaxID=297713 RepID=A0AAW0D7W7_9AGAR
MSTPRQRRRKRLKGFQAFTKLFSGNNDEAAELREEFADPLSFDQPNSRWREEIMKFVGPAYETPPGPRALLNDYLSWFYKLPYNNQPVAIRLANQAREYGVKLNTWTRYITVKDLLLNPRDIGARARYETILDDLPTRTVVDYDQEHEYPPRDEWIYDCKEAGEKWRFHITEGPQPDRRIKRKEMHEVDLKELDHDIGPKQSVRFVDGEGALVLLVIRDFCTSDAACEWADSVALRNVDDRRSIRLEDAGSIVMSGWSAGSRSSPQFHWARNLLRKASPEQAEKLAYEASWAFALFWNLCKAVLPRPIIEDFETFIRESGIYRMDPGTVGEGPEGMYSIMTEEGWVTFRNVEMAPPCGVFAKNYARATHNESQPHKWAISWTTQRRGDVKDGGHFYNCQYRVRIQAAPNTLIAWQPVQYHATSLQNVDPYDADPAFVQSGLALVTSSRIQGVFLKYMDKKITATQAAEECFRAGYQDDEP